jgi:hypothetical protein
MLVGGLLVGLPAIVVVAYFMGSVMMFPAVVSLIIAAIPFAIFGYVLSRGEQGEPLE